MGNRNHSQRSSMKKPKSNIETIRNESKEHQVIDLDEIVENWVWSMWNRTKTKSSNYYKREQLLININWKHVSFLQSQTHIYGSPPVRLPKSQILFRTNFNNKTTSEQSYLLKTERFTCSKFRFEFTKSLKHSQESFITFHIPKEIAELNGGIKNDQDVKLGQDTTNEYNMRWYVDTPIRVGPHTRTYAELNIDEEEFQGDFLLGIRFFGRISARIASRNSPNTYLKLIDGDIVQIIREAMENKYPLSGIEVLEELPPVVQFIMHGKCSFRYGVQQHVILNQESLSPSSSNLNQDYGSSTRTEYRPLRPYLVSSNNALHLHVQDDELL